MSSNQQFIIALIAAVVPIVALLVQAIRHIRELHISVNSRLTELLRATAELARAEGRLEVRDAKARARKGDE